MLRDQHQLVLLDEERALRALPTLLRAGEPDAVAALAVLSDLLTAAGPLSKDEKSRLAQVEIALGARLSLMGAGERT